MGLRTIESAIKIISHDRDPSPDAIKEKSLGLQILLLGLAETQALRVEKLVTAVRLLEEQIFSDDVIRQQDPRTVMSLYKLANESLVTSYTYVKEVVSQTKWKDLELSLVELDAVSSRTGSTAEYSELTKELLNQLRKIKSE